MQRAKRGTATTVVLLVSSTAALAQAPRASVTGRLGGQAPVSTSRQKNPDVSPTAEDLLRELRRKRPVRELIQPVSVSGRTERPAGAALVPEGTSVVDRVGRLLGDGADWLFVSELQPEDSDGRLAPIRLLPSASLEVMVRTVRGSTLPVTFVVSGEMTVFEEQNHLLIRHVRRSDRGKPGAGTPPKRGAVPAAAAPAEDVLAALRQARPAEQPLSPDPPSARAMQNRDALATVTLIPEGTPIVRRPGRLILDGRSWAFAFESDSTEVAEPPMRVLANLNTELMVRSAEGVGAGQVFIVSGEVTLFEGQNYLLPRVAMRRIDAGNFRK